VSINNILQAILNLFCSVEEKMVGIFEALGIFTKEVVSTVDTIPFTTDTQNSIVLNPNPNRQGFIANNISSSDMYLAFNQNVCSDTSFTLKIAAGDGVFYIPVQKAYTGIVRIYFKDVSGTGFATITELSYV